MGKRILVLSPIVLFAIWVVVFKVEGASVWAGFAIAVFATLGLAKMTGLAREAGDPE